MSEEPENDVADLPIVKKSKEHHKHPCICDGGYRVKKKTPLTRAEAFEKSLQFLRSCTKEELDKRGALKSAIRATAPGEGNVGHYGASSADEEELDEEEIEQEKLERQRRRAEFKEKKRRENLCMQTKDVPGMDYELRYLKEQERIFDNRKGTIKWKKDPVIPNKTTRTSNLRKEHNVYCKKKQLFQDILPTAGGSDRTLPPPPPPTA